METSHLIKIVVTGPESTGKSTLCALLATHYQTLWVKEYAREYLEKNGVSYQFEDLYKIASGQIDDEENLCRKMNETLLFCDTDLRVIKIWSEFVFNRIDNRILTEIASRQYDLYLLCDVDLPWIKDELREYPDVETRRKLFHYYNEEMASQTTPWAIIRGDYAAREAAAVNIIDSMFPRLQLNK